MLIPRREENTFVRSFLQLLSTFFAADLWLHTKGGSFDQQFGDRRGADPPLNPEGCCCCLPP